METVSRYWICQEKASARSSKRHEEQRGMQFVRYSKVYQGSHFSPELYVSIRNFVSKVIVSRRLHERALFWLEPATFGIRSLITYPLDKSDHLFQEAVTGLFKYRYTTLPPVSRWI
ncbi:hypothetical protein TNCV_4373971 [Trichonephila clavipes]|uniref:Uncharacterized protein n=1 Tax=Trichonephila clavipes TaxID=2585209 RepID=A0A8X6UXP9_TRICX|nr:hypothetical protein TNCV_4373971 [Trichonephila clavipes]